MTSRVIQASAVLLLIIVLLGKAGHAHQLYLSMFFSLDNYFLYDASRELLQTGVGRVPFLPHSSQGWDLFLWTYFVPMYAYAFLLQLFDFQFHQSAFLHFAQYVVLVAVTWIAFKRHFGRHELLLALLLVLLEPLYFSITAAHFHLWPITFALLGVTAFEASFSIPGNVGGFRKHGFSALAGLMAGASLFSFPAIGLPVAAGLSLAFLCEALIDESHWRKALFSLTPYVFGTLLPLVLFVLDVLTSLDAAQLRQLIATLTYHYGTGSETDLLRTLARGGYFLAGVLVSPRAPTLLFGGLLLTALAYYSRHKLGKSDQRFVRLAVILSMAWLAFGILIPHHVNAPRMVALLPIYAVVFGILLRHPKVLAPFILPLLIIGIVDFGAQTLYHSLGRPAHPYGVGLAAAGVLVIAIVVAISTRLAASQNLSRFLPRHMPFAALALVLGVCVVAPSLAKSARSLETAWGTFVESTQREPLLPVINARLQEVMRDLVDGNDRVLSNVAMREYLAPDVRRHQIRFYRGLFSGVTERPADAIVLVGNSPDGDFYPNYHGIKVGHDVYYRGHVYRPSQIVSLGKEYYALIGGPSPEFETNANNIIYPDDHVPRAAIKNYLEWRRSRHFLSD